MTAATARGPARKRRCSAGGRVTDQEFLPAALEILETPPSPIRMTLIVIICAFFATALIWAYFGRIDIIAVAQGKLQPAGRVKVIQPLEPGKVLASFVENGQRVRAGDLLVELDPSESGAEVAETAANLSSFEAEAARRTAAIRAVHAGALSDMPKIDVSRDIPAAIREREELVIVSDLLHLRSEVASLTAQANQKKAEAARLSAMIAAQETLIETLQERVDMRQELIARRAGSKSTLIDALETFEYQKTMLAQQTGQRAEAEASLKVIARDTDKLFETFIADNAQKLAEAERQAADLKEKLAKARARLALMALRSPIDGVVQGSVITTVGQVVTSGEEIMRIVPQNAELEIECYLQNKDIGFVKDGQRAVIKVESFPYTRYGTINAEVTRVARDAIPEPDAEQAEGDAARAMKSATASGGQRTQNLVFQVTLKPERTTIEADGSQIPLGAGMAVSAEIRTGSRRILEYIFSPLIQIGSEAMKER